MTNELSEHVSNKIYTVTGAFSYSGKYITERLVEAGARVRTLTNHPDRTLSNGRVKTSSYTFNNREKLVENLKGSDTLFNTYWVRFPYGDMTFDQAIDNSKRLIKAAEEAGVRRIIHTSIINPDHNSSLPYFSGKAIVEDCVKESELSYAILRPTVMFGHEGILINNIAWFLRRLPVFGIPGEGSYKIQPVHVEDFSELAVEAAIEDENLIFDVAGPEQYTFNDIVYMIADKIGSKSRIIHVPPQLSLAATKIIGHFVDDIVLTKDEIRGLMNNYLWSDNPACGKTKFSTWLEENKKEVGKEYASELKKHF